MPAKPASAWRRASGVRVAVFSSSVLPLLPWSDKRTRRPSLPKFRRWVSLLVLA